MAKSSCSGLTQKPQSEMDVLIAYLRQYQQSGQRWEAEIRGFPDGHVTLSIKLLLPLEPPISAAKLNPA